MELFTADRSITAGDEFPGDNLTPFPQPTDLLFLHHHHPAGPTTPGFHSHHHSPLIQPGPQPPPPPPPPQKLRPIRGNAKAPSEYSQSNPPPSHPLENGAFSDVLLNCQSIDFPELGFLSPIDGDPMTMGCSDSLTAQSPDSSGGVLAGNGFPPAETRAPPSQVKLEVDPKDINLIPQGFVSGDESGSLSTDATDTLEEITGSVSRKRKRKPKDELEQYVVRLMMKVMKKQELMHKQLIEIIEKRDRERILREDAWMQQQMKRAERDEELRAQERSRNLALISFIQKVLGQDIQIPHSLDASCTDEVIKCEVDCQKDLKGDHQSNKRWTKSEIQALVTIRTTMDEKFRGEGLKRLLWEEVSAGLLNIGYNRTTRQCREKWENINKYFKRSINSSEKRSNSLPYFHELDILYRNGFASEAVTNSSRTRESSKE